MYLAVGLIWESRADMGVEGSYGVFGRRPDMGVPG